MAARSVALFAASSALNCFDDEAQLLVLAHDLLLEPWRQHSIVAGAHLVEVGDEARLERLDVAHALTEQQASLIRLPCDVRSSTSAPGARVRRFAILVLHRGHKHHAADPRLAAQMRQKRSHQLLQIDPVGLGAPRTTVHLDAGRVDLMIDDASSRQPSVQPVPVQTGLSNDRSGTGLPPCAASAR